MFPKKIIVNVINIATLISKIACVQVQAMPAFKYNVLKFMSFTIETLIAVLELFVQAYNAFGIAKMNFRLRQKSKSRELPFSVLDFL